LGAPGSRDALERGVVVLGIGDDADGEKGNPHARGDAGRIGALHVFGIGSECLAHPTGEIDLAVEGVGGPDRSRPKPALIVRRVAGGGEKSRIARKTGERLRFDAADAEAVRHGSPLSDVDSGAEVFVSRPVAAEVGRARAEDDVENLKVGIMSAGGSLIDDGGWMESVDGEGSGSGGVDGTLLGARDDDGFRADSAGPVGPTADLDLMFGLERIEQRAEFKIDGAFDEKVVAISCGERRSENGKEREEA